MKHSVIRIIKLCILITLTFALGACTLGFEDAASVSFAIPREAFDRARNITLDSEDNTELHVLSIIRGKKTDVRFNKIRDDFLDKGKHEEITLTNLPVGEEISIELNVFNSDGDWYYYGITPKFEVLGGINKLKITLQDFDKAEATYNFICELKYDEKCVDNNDGIGTLNLLDNGFYVLKTNIESETYGSGTVISEGRWTADSDGTIHLTEYLYSTIILGDTLALSSLEKIIPTKFNEYSFTLEEGNFSSLILQNGVNVNGFLST